AVFNDGINYTKFFKPEFSSTKHDQYFPVKIVFGMTKTDKAYWFNGINPTLTRYGGLIDTSYISAYDMSDADNPRRLNIVYNAFRKPDLIFTQESKSVIYVTHSSYDPSGDAYPDSTGKMGDSYLALELALNDLNDTTLYDIQAGIMELIIEPTFVNSNADKFSFSSASLVTTATTAERKDVLEKVKVVPNPYFAYSSYETSYDTPVIKFTNMDSRATIRIFTVSGQLVTTIEKDDLTNEVTWDLRNDASLKVSSGIY
ncbi:MAG: hypothetical protein GY808_11985, partial [Gammaproteobacteria bacterium]|nr:hypothetical protein [Gammaproteobacteria bacterium]